MLKGAVNTILTLVLRTNEKVEVVTTGGNKYTVTMGIAHTEPELWVKLGDGVDKMEEHGIVQVADALQKLTENHFYVVPNPRVKR